MHATGLSEAFRVLTEEDPSYDELVSLYNDLRRTTTETPEGAVSRRALAQVLGEVVDYLDFVAADLEKSVGLSRTAERERVLAAFEAPRGSTPDERVAHLIEQWESLERHSHVDVAERVESL